MSSKKWLLVVVASVALSALASAFATTAVQGRGGGESAANPFTPLHAQQTAQHQFRSAVESAKKKKRKGEKIRYLYFLSTAKAGDKDGGYMVCPKRNPHAIGGFFLPSGPEGLGQLALTNNYPILNKAETRARSWDIGLRNLSTVDQEYLAGIICIS